MERANFRLDGKVALLTGAARGIGLGMAQALAAAGASVAIQDIDMDAAKASADAINAAGCKAVALPGDAGDLSLPAALVEQTVAALGGLHFLFNNVGIQRHGGWETVNAEEFERTFRVNLLMPLLLCQQAVPIFQRQKFGRIINIGSGQQRNGNPGMLAYSMTKAALWNMTTGLAVNLAGDGITVNQIAPGWFNTDRNRHYLKTQKDVDEAGKKVPAGRLGEPRDCGGIAVLLCSDAGEYITGQSIFVAGGL